MTETDKLVQEFADCVVAQTDAIKAADHETGNRFARGYSKAFKTLRVVAGGRDALAALLLHQRDDVRAMAAAFLLRHRTAEASAVLRELAHGKGVVAFGAIQALKRWQEGTWDLDPSDEHP